ncbi:hypothetical protein [Bogoriella caseilytica]|uniref:Fumarate reductase subunit C n=1 Tax=Bogoriella caseilytica TaxID=56055 RepID=A0A3N2B9M4_9MICO|nr:hypothetical protein [Bogoriella caseilytica]ROR71969.1 fumarate reductase subunit C [Bogoriella caseilytica]
MNVATSRPRALPQRAVRGQRPATGAARRAFPAHADSGVLTVLDERGVGQPMSHRRPYFRPLPRLWFLRSREFRAYALREVSSFVVGFFVLDLVVGLVALHLGPQAWEWWLRLQVHPVNVALIVLALAMTIVHAVTWFAAAPKIVKVRLGRSYLGDGWIIAAQYLALAAVAAALVFWLILGGAS